MVSDIILGAIIGGVIALAGVLLSPLTEPVRTRFVRKAHQAQLRRILYGELLNKLEMVRGYLLEYNVKIRGKDIDYLGSTDKLELSGPISFPDEDTVKKQYYQLPPQEFDPLAAAYHQLRIIIKLVNKFGLTSFDRDDATQEHDQIEKHLQFGLYYINKAFEDNVRVLKRLDDGAILNAWRKLMQEPRMRRYLKEAGVAAEKPAEKRKRKLIILNRET
jgi:hypothetical protein